jgi:predicted outer membrane repeat protein
MRLKLLRAAATVAVLGGTATIGLGPTQTALADQTIVHVPCSTATLNSDMTSPLNDTVLILAPGCTYWLTGALPTVMNELMIVGNDSSLVRSYAKDTDQFSILMVGSTNGDLTLINVNVRNGGNGEGVSGSDDGGAVYINPGTVTIHGGTFSGNRTNYYGGAIYNLDGTLTVDGATFSDNSSFRGGAIYSEGLVGTTTLNGGTFTGNNGEWGGAVYGDDNDMTIIGGIYRQNFSGKQGGAIDNVDWMQITQAMIGQNTAYTGGGVFNNPGATLTIDNSVLTLNQATHDEGGAIYNWDGTVNLSDDTIGINFPDNCYPVGSITGCRG